MRNNSQTYAKGVILFIGSSLCLAFINILAGSICFKVPPMCIVFCQMLTAFLLYLPYSLKGGVQKLRTTQLKIHGLRGLIAITGVCLYYSSMKFLPLINVVLLENTTPFIIPFVSMVWLREKISLKLWASILLGFVGVYYILKPEESFFNIWTLVPLLAALCVSVVSVAIAKLNETESDKQIMFYFFGFTTLLSFPFFVKEVQHLSPQYLLPMAGVGMLYALSQLFVIFAYKQSLPGKLSPFIFTENLFTVFLRWMIYGELLSQNIAVGLAFILASACMMLFTRQAVIE